MCAAAASRAAGTARRIEGAASRSSSFIKLLRAVHPRKKGRGNASEGECHPSRLADPGAGAWLLLPED